MHITLITHFNQLQTSSPYFDTIKKLTEMKKFLISMHHFMSAHWLLFMIAMAKCFAQNAKTCERLTFNKCQGFEQIINSNDKNNGGDSVGLGSNAHFMKCNVKRLFCSLCFLFVIKKKKRCWLNLTSFWWSHFVSFSYKYYWEWQRTFWRTFLELVVRFIFGLAYEWELLIFIGHTFQANVDTFWIILLCSRRIWVTTIFIA